MHFEKCIPGNRSSGEPQFRGTAVPGNRSSGEPQFRGKNIFRKEGRASSPHAPSPFRPIPCPLASRWIPHFGGNPPRTREFGSNCMAIALKLEIYGETAVFQFCLCRLSGTILDGKGCEWQFFYFLFLLKKITCFFLIPYLFFRFFIVCEMSNHFPQVKLT